MSSLRISSPIDLAANRVSQAPEAEANWYAVYTLPNHEKRAAQYFEARSIEAFLPLYRADHRWKNGCKVAVYLPLFPHYLFVRIPARERARVVQVPGVRAIVGTRRELLPLPQFEIDALRAGVHQCQAQPHPYLKTGSKVRVKSGPLMGLEGIIWRTTDRLRVVITIELIMRSIAVEVDAHDLELLRVPGQPTS